MHAMLYVTAVHKMSCSGDTKQTSEHLNSHNSCSSVLTEFRSVICWCLCVWRLSAVQTGSVSGRQMGEIY